MPGISVGISSEGNGFSGSLSQAGQEITQLRDLYQAQSDAIKANTAALQRNAGVGQGSSSIGDVAKSAATSFLGGGIASAIPLISAIAGLFGGGKQTPAPLIPYAMPSPINIQSTISNAGMPAATPSGQVAARAQQSIDAGGEQSKSGNTETGRNLSFSPHVTVNVNAMDSKSFLDRSSDIADAVREAVLNLHPLNNVLADL